LIPGNTARKRKALKFMVGVLCPPQTIKAISRNEDIPEKRRYL
jgi:hypothetical protein